MVGKKQENVFCGLVADTVGGCAACLAVQNRLATAEENPATETCFADLCDSAVPLRVGGRVVGFLQTGQVALRKPSPARFPKIARQLASWGESIDLEQFEKAWLKSRVLSKKEYTAMIRLLEIFAEQLSEAANRIVVAAENEEPPLIAKARKHIAAHAEADLSLDAMAEELHVSTFHFCKTFRKATGLTFTEYLARVRVEKARLQLGDPNLRVSEIAFACGFGSLGHFNRTFKRIVGLAPTDFRRAGR